MIARWAIRAAIIAALAALVVWIAMNTYWDAVPIPQPLKGEAAASRESVANAAVLRATGRVRGS